MGSVLNSQWSAGLHGIFVTGRRLCWPVVFGWWAQLVPFTASSGGLVGPKQVGWPLRWSLRHLPGAVCLRRPVLWLRGLLSASVDPTSALPSSSFRLRWSLFSKRWVCAAPQPLRFWLPWPPHLPSVGASPLSLGPGCSFPPPIDLWVFAQFSTCLRQVKLESCSSAWARSHGLTAFLTSPRVFLELTSPSSPLSASHVSRGPGGQHLSPLLPGDNIFLVL